MHPEARPPMRNDGRPPMKKAGPRKIIADQLHFDKEQVIAYEKLIETHQASIHALDDSILIAKNNLYQTLQDEMFTGKDSLVNRLGALQKQVELVHYEHFTAIKALCKPDQLDRFNKLSNDLARFFSSGKKNAPPPKD